MPSSRQWLSAVLAALTLDSCTGIAAAGAEAAGMMTRPGALQVANLALRREAVARGGDGS